MSEKKEYIERGALIEKLKEKITTNYLSLYDEDTLESIIRFAEKQPAADVEPVVRGEWVEMRDPYGDLTGWIHEECGRETNAATEYCSKCGAKMTFVERSGSGE